MKFGFPLFSHVSILLAFNSGIKILVKHRRLLHRITCSMLLDSVNNENDTDLDELVLRTHDPKMSVDVMQRILDETIMTTDNDTKELIIIH